MIDREPLPRLLAAGLLGLAALAHPYLHASADETMTAIEDWLDARAGAEWSGPNELWVDPTGNRTELSDGTLKVAADRIVYTWAWKDTPHRGELRWDDGWTWTDSWHQPERVRLEPVRDHGALIAGEYSYPAGTGPDWHWRIKLAERPDGTVVLQMTNIAPWGEEARAVRMVVGDPRPED